MADPRLKQCSVLVVDDRAPSRTLVATTLHDIGVGTVNTVPHGAAAIEHLQHSAFGALNGPTPPVDLVISEWDMEPVGGLMLVNWIRRSVNSPDRFTRTVIMSGALDMEKVEQARAAGVNAVFSKPFTIGGLTKHLGNVLGANPAYFKTPTYFGPDRRRRAQDAVLSERRAILHAHHEVLGAGDAPEVGCFDLPNYMEPLFQGVPRARIDYSQRYGAHEQLASFNEDYADWARKDIATLRMAFRAADQQAASRQRNLSIMRAIVLRLEREGDHMNYPLISALAHTLKHALNADDRLWESTLDIYDAAIKGLEAVVRERISGMGGVVGRALNASLSEMDQKLLRLSATPFPRRNLAAYGGQLPEEEEEEEADVDLEIAS